MGSIVNASIGFFIPKLNSITYYESISQGKEGVVLLICDTVSALYFDSHIDNRRTWVLAFNRLKAKFGLAEHRDLTRFWCYGSPQDSSRSQPGR